MEKDQKGFKIDTVYEKVIFKYIPEGTIVRDTTKVVVEKNSEGLDENVTQKIKCNTAEKAFIRLRIPMREQTHSEHEAEKPPNSRAGEDDDVEQKPDTAAMDSDEEIKMVEEGQDDKAL